MAALKEMGYTVSSADRVIDNHNGKMIYGFNASLNSQIYAAVWDMDNTTQCSIFSHYPWDRGTLQLVRTIHVEYQPKILLGGAKLASIMLGQYKIEYDYLLDILNQNKMGPIDSETLSGIPYTQYGLNGTNQDNMDAAMRINKYDRAWDFDVNLSVKETLEKLGCSDLDIVNRTIDGHIGAVGEGTDVLSNTKIYAAAWKMNNATECSILSSYPWDEGTRQLLDTIHIEYRPEYSDLGHDSFKWTFENFPGFYYDPDQGISTELLEFRLTGIGGDKSAATLSDQIEPDGYGGILYITGAKKEDFKFEPWGSYDVIGFLGEKYLAAYDPDVTEGMVKANEADPFLYANSGSTNLISSGQISRVLIDNGTEISVTSNDVSPTIKLKEGYQLTIKSFDINGNKAYIELTKNGKVVDSKVIQPSIENAGMNDKTYRYKMDLGDTKRLITIAVHFKEISRSHILTIYGTYVDMWKFITDGIFQISDAPTEIQVDQVYGMMSVREVDPNSMIIAMDNRGHQIELSKDSDIALLPKIHIKALNQDIIDVDHPLIYGIYPYKPRMTFPLLNRTIHRAGPVPVPEHLNNSLYIPILRSPIIFSPFIHV